MNDWQKQISRWSAYELVDALGCGVSTAYAWLDGKRQPPAWLQPVILAWLQNSKENKKAFAAKVKVKPQRKPKS